MGFFPSRFLIFSFSTFVEEGASDHKVSITISPFHLLNPEFHLTGELQLTPKISMAAILGAGKITDAEKTCNIWEAGGQFRYYILGSFAHGTMIGADAGYIDIDAQIENPIAYLVGAHAGGFWDINIRWGSGLLQKCKSDRYICGGTVVTPLNSRPY